MALLEVGLQEERHVSGAGSALGHLLLEEGEVQGTEPIPPGGPRLLQERLGDPGLAPDEPAVQEAEGHPHVISGSGEDLGGPADRVVQVDSFVPDGVPDGIGDLADVPDPVVDEDDIEVAEGAERAPAVATYRDQGQVPAGVPSSPFGQAGEPDVRLGGIAPTEFLAPQPGFGQQIAAPVAE